MSTSTETQFDLLEPLLKQAIRPDPKGHDIFARADAEKTDDLLLVAGGSSVPRSVALFQVCSRFLLTMSPIIASDLAALALTCVLIHLIHWTAGTLPAEMSGGSAGAAIGLMLVCYWLSGLYSEIWVHPVIELRQLSRVTALVLLAAAMGGFVSQALPLWCAIALPLALLLVPLFRNLTRRLLASQKWWGFPTLVIGAGAVGDEVVCALLRDRNCGLRPVLLTDPLKRCRTSLVPVVNCGATLESIVRTRMIRHAVVALPEYSSAQLGEAVDRFSDLVPHLLVLSDRATLPMLWSTSRRGGQLSGMEVRNGLMLLTLQAVKRVIDLTTALTALVLTAPLLLLVALLVKLSSPGPILFGHSRIGRHGKVFKAWKFRTMRQNADQVLHDYLANNPQSRAEWEKGHKLRDDPRVTRFGAFARKTSLDELPQLWNVLIGDMSLVGPRPIVTAEVRRYGELFPLYATAKPGITGMWQVSGRNDIGYEERILLDQFYIRHWSPWLDIYIMAKTIVVLISRSGAY